MGAIRGAIASLLRAACLVYSGWVLFHAWQVHEGGPGRGVSLYWMREGSLMLIVPLAWFVTAGERLHPSIARCIPRNRWLATLTTPFLPGGGRGVLIVLSSLGLRDVIAWRYIEWLAVAHPGGSRPVDLQVMRRIMVVDGSIFVLLALPSAIFARWTPSLWVRVAGFAAIVGLAGLILHPPSWVPGWRGLPSWVYWSEEQPTHVGYMGTSNNGAYLLWPNWEATKGMIQTSLALGCIMTLAINLPRMVGGVREVVRASAARKGDPPSVSS